MKKHLLLSIPALLIAASVNANIDANLVKVNPATGSAASYVLQDRSVEIGGIIRNDGSAILNDFTVKYAEGINAVVMNVTNANIAPGAEYTFTFTQPFTVNELGVHSLDITVSAAGDDNASNDGQHIDINGVAFIPVHHVTVEEATGTWCGWCVRGIVFMDSIHAVHSDCDVIAVHDSDPMAYATYDNAISALIQGYPSILVGRDVIDDPSNVFPLYNNTIGDFGTADLVPVVSYNASTRHITVDVSATFAVALNGDYRLACVVTEDSCHNANGGTWDQHNYYAGGGYGPMIDPETGWNFATQPGTIPSSTIYYNFVARTILGGVNGMAGSLPANIPINSTQTYQFNYTHAVTYNPAHMKVVVLLIDNTQATKHIMNSASGAVLTGMQDLNSSIGSVNLFPNPGNENTSVYLSLNNTEHVTISVYDMAGALISTSDEGEVMSGDHNFAISTTDLSSGMYIVKVNAGSSVESLKLMVDHN